MILNGVEYLEVDFYTTVEGGKWYKAAPKQFFTKVTLIPKNKLQVTDSENMLVVIAHAIRFTNDAEWDIINGIRNPWKLSAPAVTALEEPEKACPTVNPDEKNEGARILQTQQNITCRLESIKKLCIDLQADMQYLSPQSAAYVRDIVADVMQAQDRWLLDTRRKISALPMQAAEINSIRNRPANLVCEHSLCTYPNCNCKNQRL